MTALVEEVGISHADCKFYWCALCKNNVLQNYSLKDLFDCSNIIYLFSMINTITRTKPERVFSNLNQYTYIRV